MIGAIKKIKTMVQHYSRSRWILSLINSKKQKQKFTKFHLINDEIQEIWT